MRYLIIITSLFMALAFGPAWAQAAGSDSARQYVDSVGQQVLTILNDQAEETSKQQSLRQLFTQNVDMDWMARFVLGPAWNQANADQKNRYLSAYKNYLLSRYTQNFSDYAGSQYTVTGVKAEQDGQYTVGMKVNSPNAEEKETMAGYRLLTENGQFRIIDIIVEGVSLITTQRSEFSSVVQTSGMDGLIQQLQNKTKSGRA